MFFSVLSERIWGGGINYFSTFHHACMYQLLLCLGFTLNLKNKKLKSHKIWRIYKKYICIEISENCYSRKSFNESVSIKSFLFCKRFSCIGFDWKISIIHYVEDLNLISTLEVMIKSALEKRLQYSDPRSIGIQKE